MKKYNNIKKKNVRRKRLNIPKIIFTLLILVLIVFAIKYIFFNKNTKKTDLGIEVVSQNIVSIEDNEAPELVLNGKEYEVLAKGNTYSDKMVIAKDNLDGDITDKVKVEGDVDTLKEGIYELIYSVKDEAGNENSIKRTVEVRNSLGNKGLPVLMYHFFYDENKTAGQDNNWLEISDFEEQIQYLSDNNFYFPTWEEVENYIDGKINLPQKSIVLTVDDGDDSFFELAVPILQKYNVDATSFVITSWYGYRANEKQKNVSYQSHSDCMHEGATNGKGVMLSWPIGKIVEDLNASNKTLGENATVFCYPFGQYNDGAILALKQAGFKLAFTTQGGRVYKGSDKYKLPRVRILKTTTMKEFKNMVN